MHETCFSSPQVTDSHDIRGMPTFAGGQAMMAGEHHGRRIRQSARALDIPYRAAELWTARCGNSRTQKRKSHDTPVYMPIRYNIKYYIFLRQLS